MSDFIAAHFCCWQKMLISSNLFVHLKMKLLFYSLYSKNVSTVRWRFWHPEVWVNTSFLLLVSILQPGTQWRRGSDLRISQATPLQCRTRQVSVHVPSLHKPSIASLARRQANAVEFTTKFASRSSMAHWGIAIEYKLEIVQCVATRKLMTCLAYRYTYVDRG